MPGALLRCPIRGELVVPEKASDGLTYTEEKRRIDCINFLLAKGYPPSHFKIETVLFRFGHKGKNSFRTDLAVLDVSASSIPNDPEVLKAHVKLVAEIKRGNADAKVAKKTQVQPAMDFVHDLDAVGVYWDDVEQRLFYRTTKGNKTTTHETSLAVLPTWGQPLGKLQIRSSDLRASGNLRILFEDIENRLHSEVSDKGSRFEIMQQLLLTKLYDEHTHVKPSSEMGIQDFTDSPLGDADVRNQFNAILAKATKFYAKYLPKKVEDAFSISGAMLRSLSAPLAPVKILGSKRDVVQDFYMYFAKGVYKWDLAQYFTPSEVVDFIVATVNPRAGDQVKDPACGSGDFLISAFHHADSEHNDDIRDSVWGADNSENAVQVAILNMVLNKDGKSNVRKEDSLASVDKQLDQYDVLLCNPPSA